MSPITACRGGAFPFTAGACVGVDAPLVAIARVSSSLRFAADGDAGAGGSDGGVRVPLAAAMVTLGLLFGDARVMPWDGTTRSGRPRSSLVCLVHQHALASTIKGAVLKIREGV